METGICLGSEINVLPCDPEFLRHFELISRIGNGGMSTVYKARQIQFDRMVAVKFLLPELTKNKTALARFKKEAHILSELNHPNIVKVYSFGICEQQPYLVMEYVDGLPLSEVMKRGNQDPQKFLCIFEQTLAGLEYAHRRGIVHRDLKPHNLMLLGENHEDVKIVDFGVAKNIDKDMAQHLTHAGAIVGTAVHESGAVHRFCH